MSRFPLPALLVFVLPLTADDKPAVLDGVYKITALSHDAVKVPDESLKAFESVTIKGDKYIMKTKDDKQTATIKIDAKAKPATIDLTQDDGPEKGTTLVGIWKLEKGVLTIAIAQKNRPTNFDGKGVDEILIEMKSVTDKPKK